MILLDTSFVLALLNGSDDHHQAASNWYEATNDRFVTSPLVLAELDYLLRTRATSHAVELFHGEVGEGNFGVEWEKGLEGNVAAVAARYASLGVSLTDASLVVLGDRFETTRIATFDERHFRAVKPLAGGDSFTLLPADA